jgi:hypothetical protein
MSICRLSRLSFARLASKSPLVATRIVSPMACVVTPRSAARAASGRTVISGRSRLAVETTPPKCGRPRSSRSMVAGARLERARVLAREDDLKLLPGRAAAEREACTRHVEQTGADLALDHLLLRTVATFREHEREQTFAHGGSAVAVAA